MAHKKPGKPPAADPAEQAINRVLEAERETDRVVADCEREANGILQAARQHARRIHERTDHRITLMKMRVAQRTAATIQSREREEKLTARDQSAMTLDETGLAECIEQVACLLSGGDPGQGRDSGQ
jgi:vacuolar-type H+-ATPase subunit H